MVFLCSCTLGISETDLGLGDFYQVQGHGYKFTFDRVRYLQLDFNRKDPTLCQVNFEIKAITREGSELTLEIERPKGCNGIYELVWDGLWQETAPSRMQVYLTGLFSSCSPISETELDVIKVDLANSIRENPTGQFSIYLREHYSFRDFNCVGNCNLRS